LDLNSVAVVSKFGSKEAEDAAKKVAKKILTKKSEVFTISPVEVDGAKKVSTVEELRTTNLDLTITLGGDGTTLRAFRYLENEVPLLGINVGGNRGILSEITLDQIDTAIEQILSNNIFLDRRTRVVASCKGQEQPPALNEIYINRQNLGGPILHESLDVLIITPVAPVNRLPSLVVPDEKIEIITSHDCNIIMDAQVIKPASYDDVITIRKYKKQAVFVRLKKQGLRQMSKLGF